MTEEETHYPLNSLYLYLTDRCNLRCIHCWISPKYSNDRQEGIPFEPLKKAIIEAKPLGLGCVKLTGGEPLLYKRFKELLTFLTKEEVSISIETNGTLIDKDFIKAIREFSMDHIAVSLDASAPAIHDAIRGVKGSFELAVNGLRLLRETDLSPQVIITLQRRNANEIPEMIQLCRELNAGSLKINNLLPTGRGINAFQRSENLEIDEFLEKYQEVQREIQKTEDLEIIFDIPLALRSIEEIKHKDINECEIRTILGILANGDYSICGIGETVPELRMGNITKNSIRDVWQSNSTLCDLRKSLPNKLSGICHDCIFRYQCLGCCRANAYAVSGDLYAPFFLCQRLHETNRFPSSRYVETVTG